MLNSKYNVFKLPESIKTSSYAKLKGLFFYEVHAMVNYVYDYFHLAKHRFNATPCTFLFHVCYNLPCLKKAS